MSRPDAVRLPDKFRFGKAGELATRGRFMERVFAIADIAEPLLGCDRSQGERAYIRRMPRNAPLFITRSPDDTLYFPTGHPRAGQERYRWETMPDGVAIGYLIDD
jgi:hypothetical protein